jgi:hypothetical protein
MSSCLIMEFQILIALGLKELFPNLAASDATALGMHGLADGYLIAERPPLNLGRMTLQLIIMANILTRR